MFRFGIIALVSFGVCFGGTLPERCGDTANQGGFPWLVQILAEDDKRVCSGFIINDRFVVTAGVCSNNPQRKIKTVVVGEGNKERKIEIDSKYTHPEYTQFKNDISLIKLKDRLEFDEYISPVCLTNEESRRKAEPDSFTVAGWRFKSQSGPRVSIKTKDVDIQKCNELIKVAKVTLGKEHLCANGEDICDTISGNPLMYKTGDKWYAEGITSFGATCPSPLPTVYTNINQYIDFIVKTVNEN